MFSEDGSGEGLAWLELAFLRHELAQPLLYLMSSLAVARRKLRAALGPEDSPEFDPVMELLGAAEEAASHLIDLIRRIGLRDAVDDMARVDLASLVESTLWIVSDEVKRRAALETVLPSLPSHVLCDPTRLRQVLLNLLSNALHAVEGLERGRARIAVRLLVEPTREVVLEVEDNGVGIDPDDQRRLGQPYFTTNPRRGSGLGLAFVRRILASLGVTMTLDSEPGIGTKIRIVLPPAPPVDPEGGSPESAP
jgi:two-component system, NtrC family, sensor kinase